MTLIYIHLSHVTAYWCISIIAIIIIFHKYSGLYGTIGTRYTLVFYMKLRLGIHGNKKKSIPFLSSFCISDTIHKNNPGWWFEPLWKIWKSIGMMTFPIYGKIKLMFQTTNQILYGCKSKPRNGTPKWYPEMAGEWMVVSQKYMVISCNFIGFDPSPSVTHTN